MHGGTRVRARGASEWNHEGASASDLILPRFVADTLKSDDERKEMESGSIGRGPRDQEAIKE